MPIRHQTIKWGVTYKRPLSLFMYFYYYYSAISIVPRSHDPANALCILEVIHRVHLSLTLQTAVNILKCTAWSNAVTKMLRLVSWQQIHHKCWLQYRELSCSMSNEAMDQDKSLSVTKTRLHIKNLRNAIMLQFITKYLDLLPNFYN